MTKLDESAITSQGQVSIPKRVRERMGLHKGDRIGFYEDEHGNILIREMEASVAFSSQDWETFLSKTKKEPVTRVKGKNRALRHLDKLSKKT